jgi:hypothetical protein
MPELCQIMGNMGGGRGEILQLENSSFRSKRHMKLILRWMRENRRVRKVCNSIGERPDEKQFVFSVEPPKIERKNPSIPQEDNTTTTTTTTVSSE